jgi:hypothetical protein
MAEITYSNEGPVGEPFQGLFGSPFLTRRPHLLLPSELAEDLCRHLQNLSIKTECHLRTGEALAFIDLPYHDDLEQNLRLEKAIDAWLSGRGIDSMKTRITTWHLEEETASDRQDQ